MFKAKFRKFQTYSEGGRGNWVEYYIFIDDCKAEELTAKINEELANKEHGYASSKTLQSIERL